MKKTLFIKNAAYLTISSLILRFAGIIFKVWLAAKISAEGIGLYQLVFSVFVLASAFTQSGIPTAVTRLAAEKSPSGGRSAISKIMRSALNLSLLLSAVTAVILFFGADIIAGKIISDVRAASAIRICSVTLFFMGASSVIKAYFIAERKASPTAFSQIIEQVIRIAFVIVALKSTLKFGLSAACAAVFAGDAVAEMVSLVYLYFRYRFHFSRLPEGTSSDSDNSTRKIIRISLPLTASRYLNSLLRTAENMLVPRALSGYSKKSALALFGMIKGMALPVLFFPSVLLNAVSTLLVPELSEASTKHRKLLVRSAIEQVILCAAVTGIFCGAIFAVGGYEIGFLLYKSADVGFLLCALSPIVPLMYIDSLCDGLLKGLDQQNFTFRVSVGDSVIRIILILLLLKRFGINSFIGIMYFSNLLTCMLNVKRLIKISGATVNPQKTVTIPVLCALSVTLIINAILNIFAMSNLVYIILLTALSAIVYTILVYRFGCINLSTVGRIRTHKKYATKTTAISLVK